MKKIPSPNKTPQKTPKKAEVEKMGWKAGKQALRLYCSSAGHMDMNFQVAQREG